ncbi:MAG: aminomethyl-transferring glycine dehydrogenase subunit GcvPA, partial [Actinomycetia bacterium]|nr:aminomethyl-transferring glycine dehydrogenase subunit GcvPA [Actinomycetes bacterium]
MNYLSISSDQREEMLKSIGVSDFDELIGDIDPDIRLKVPLSLDAGVDELELSRKVRALAAKNANTEQLISFAGAGCYDHYIPACIDYILRRPEFFTAYTPYQPEVSQGTLQAIFEYQSAICRLTGMQVANASMYDGATALAEAALMAVRASRSKRREIIVVDTLNPQWIEVLETYASSDLMDIQITTQDALLSSINENTAGVLLGYPDFEGSIVDLSPAIDAAHQAGALAVVAAHPMMLAILDSPGSFGADIVVGEAQCFGNPQSFGGPGLGYFASTEKLMRLMPGRIVGRTRDVEGKLGYVLTLSTREQHIKRERATSNICSNHALNALAAGAYLLNMGGDGLSQLAHT